MCWLENLYSHSLSYIVRGLISPKKPCIAIRSVYI